MTNFQNKPTYTTNKFPYTYSFPIQKFSQKGVYDKLIINYKHNSYIV